jgi:DNA-binding phage protein
MNRIGILIKEAMEKTGWSNYRLSKVTGILKNNLTIILGEKGNPEWTTVQKILDAIGYEAVLKEKKGGEHGLGKELKPKRKGGDETMG